MAWHPSTKPSRQPTINQSEAPSLKTLRLIDIIENNVSSLFDEFAHLPNTEIYHASLEDPRVLKEADCLVIPIYSNVFRITPILRAVNNLLSSPPPAPSIVEQLQLMYKQKSFNGILPPNKILTIPISTPHCSIFCLFAVTIWKDEDIPFEPAVVEVAISDAYQAVLNRVYSHNRKTKTTKKRQKPIETLISPAFSTAGIVVKQDGVARLMSSVYRIYLEAYKIPITASRPQEGEELRNALTEGTIARRGLRDPDELAQLIRIMVNITNAEESQPLQLPAATYINTLLSRPQTKIPIIIFGRELVLRSIREAISSPSIFGFPAIENAPTTILERLIHLCCQRRLTPWLELKREDLKTFNIIGKGAYGKVRKAQLTLPGSEEVLEVAMKEFNAEECEFDETLRNEILRETAIMSICKHPRFLSCVGACFQQKEWWLVTDLADCDLRVLLNEEGDKLSGELRLRIAIQIAYGLAELHRFDLIHRDLKSANVLVVKKGNEVEIKIADFGLCRVVNRQMTQTTGTPLWRAPEVIGRNDYTKKADVYSFAIILWEILTGDLPYKELETLSCFRFDDKIISGHRPTIPKGFESHPFVHIMTACWNGNPKERPGFSAISAKLKSIPSGSMPSEGVKASKSSGKGFSLFTWS